MSVNVQQMPTQNGEVISAPVCQQAMPAPCDIPAVAAPAPTEEQLLDMLPTDLRKKFVVRLGIDAGLKAKWDDVKKRMEPGMRNF